MSRPFVPPKPKQHNAHVTSWVSARLRRKKQKKLADQAIQNINLTVNTKCGIKVE
jgi:hypothetical protein